MKGKRAQITVFIIIGIIVLFTAAVALYITSGKKAPDREEVVVPSEIKPVYDFVTGCMSEISEEAVQLAGIQGGYVNLEKQQEIIRTPPSYIKIDPGNLIKLPMWHYEGEERIPSESFIQNEIAEHVKESMAGCLNNFAVFDPQFFVTEQGDMNVVVSFSTQDIIIKMTYPIEIESGKGTTNHEEFIAFVPVRLKKMRDVAEKIMKAENKKAFFENLTIDFLAMDRDIPMDGMLFECGPKIWKLEEIKKKLQSILRTNMVRIRVKGTDHAPFEEKESVYAQLAEDYGPEEFAQGIRPEGDLPGDTYQHTMMYFDAGIEEADDLKVYFTYEPRFGMDLFAYPSSGGLLRSNSGRGFQRFLSFLCVNIYHFTYDVRFPIKAMLRDPNAFDGKGFNFQFGFPVTVKENEPSRNVFRIRPFEDIFHDPTYCEKLGTNFVDIMVQGYDEEGYFMASGIKGVNISFQCLNRYCTIGQTGYNPALPGKYILSTAVPSACGNPFVVAEKEGYLPVTQQITSGTDTLVLTMKKLKDLDFRIVKHPYLSSSQTFGPPEELSSYEAVSIYMKQKGGKHEQILMYPNTTKIELIDGTASYEIDAFLTRYDKFSGGYSNYNLTIGISDISGKDTMLMHIFEYRPIPTSDEKSTDMILYLTGGTYLEELKPTFE